MVPTVNITEGQWNTVVCGGGREGGGWRVAEYKRRRKKNMRTIPSSFTETSAQPHPEKAGLSGDMTKAQTISAPEKRLCCLYKQ